MKQLTLLFKLASGLALVGWVLIICLPAWRNTVPLTMGVIVTLLCVLYVYLLFFAQYDDVAETQGSFLSLAGVVDLFKSPKAVLAGWVHYLAFDLMVALYIRADALQSGISHWWLIPVYLLTLVFGPAGLLMYFAMRLALTS